VAVELGVVLREQLRGLRYQPTPKRVRATVGGVAVVDSSRAVLVWEPRRIVPSYAVPAEDISAELVPSPSGDGDAALMDSLGTGSSDGTVRILSPGRFRAHTAPGDELSVRAPGGSREAAAFRLSDPDLEGYVELDFDAFDEWLEEDEPIISHPRDPFHRIDVRRSSRSVVVERGGTVLAESTRPRLLFETNLPPRSYLPREDVHLDRLQPSATRTACAYKGQTTAYWAVERADGGLLDVAWTYEHALPDAVEIAGMIAFFDERVDMVVYGVHRPRPITPWSVREP
jgi:uncharacterized protein (DUF427 family)